MRLTPLKTLVPDVEEVERLVFRVRSRGNPKITRIVDMERKHGLGLCDCPDCRCHKNLDCYHIQQVRKYISIKVAQEVMRKNQVEEEPF